MTTSPQGDRPRCRLVVAAAGYGKTAALRRWYPRADVHWCTPAETTALVDGDLSWLPDPGRPAQVVVDDLPQLTDETAQRLLATIHDPVITAGLDEVAISSRCPLGPAVSRWRGRGSLAEAGPASLALGADEITEVLSAEYELREADLAERLCEATGGWPALVHLAAQSIRAQGPPAGLPLSALAGPGSVVAAYIEDEVLGSLPAALVRLVGELSLIAPVDAGLVQALGFRRADEAVRMLAGTGLLVTADAAVAAGIGGGGVRIVPLVGYVARRGVSRRRSQQVTMIAANWYDGHGPPLAAARAYFDAGDHKQCARVLGEHGQAMLGRGAGAMIAEQVAALPDLIRDRPLQLLLGDALRTAGDVVNAALAYQVAATMAEPDAAITWRLGLIHYLRGDPRGALATFAAAGTAPGGTDPSADGALLLAWTATAHLQLGDAEQATAFAERALVSAAACGSEFALATAHIAMALCLGITGDPTDGEEHYLLAERIAERNGDAILLARILTDRSYHLICQARYQDALDVARRAEQAATVAGHANLRTIAGCNQGDALMMLGRYDEAVRRYDTVLALCQRMGSRRSAAARLGLAEVHRRRGWREQAQASYEAAARSARDAGNNQVLVCALAGLAMVEAAEDAKSAASWAEEAVRLATDKVIVPALLAQGWVWWHTSDEADAGRRLALETAAQAAGLARAQRDRAGLAEALELRAAAEVEPSRARTALREAYAIWTDTGAMMDAARTRMALAQLPDASAEDRLGALLAAEALTGAGVITSRPDVRWNRAVPDEQAAVGEVVIQVLGRFEVVVDGQPVPASQWQSRKARDLLRILIARRGRPIAREELADLLWPDDDPMKTGHRLSVLLSIVRGVLDPHRTRSGDHCVVADSASVAIDVTRIRVDVEDFLANVAYGLRLRAQGELAGARAVLLTADRAYRGDAFDDEPYADWAAPMREEARTAHINALRALTDVSRDQGDADAVVAFAQRLLTIDLYDESAHRLLVRALVGSGRHGEARRAFTRYSAAMAAIGVRGPEEVLLSPNPVWRTGQVASGGASWPAARSLPTCD